MSRFSEWRERAPDERRATLVNKLGSVPFRLGLSTIANVYAGYHPDSQARFHSHPEHRELFARFTANNRANNAGDWARFWSLVLNMKRVLDDGIEGDFAELGVWRGNTAAILAHFANLSNRRVHLFDTFEGFDKRDLAGVDSDKAAAFNNTSIKLVRRVIGPDNIGACDFHPGWFPGSLTERTLSARFCAVSLDCDLYDPMRAGLEFFYPQLNRGGIMFLHDYSSGYWAGAKQAIDEFCDQVGEYIVLMPDKSGSAFLRKSRG
jgi:hypothetical protein